MSARPWRSVDRVVHSGDLGGRAWVTLFLQCGHWLALRHHGFVPRRVRCARCAGGGR